MTTPPIALTINVGTTGAVPTPPAVIRQNLLNWLTVVNPGYTDLPGALVEDWLSTSIGAVSLSDSAAIDLINSLTPDGANAWLLSKLGQMYGVTAQQDANTSVYVVFSGTVGFPIAKGFTVSDGTHQYTVQDGGVIGSGGDSGLVFCVATQTGAWAIPPGTVTGLVTAVPGPITLTVTNPNAGTPSPGPQTEEDYRALVTQAGLASAQGMGRFLKTQIATVPGVVQRLVSVRQVDGGGWEVIVGGGDPYQVANAIWMGLFDISILVGSTIGITGITKANPAVVTTDLNHGLVTGQANVEIEDVVGMIEVNGAGPYTVTVVDEKTFSLDGVDSTGYTTYVSGGVVTPNSRNVSVDLTDYPDTYTVPFVTPPQQDVEIQLTWNTSSPNFVSPDAVVQLGVPALTSYVNAVPVGAPMNLFEMQEVFQLAVASIVPPQYLTRMVFTVSINGDVTAPLSGTGIIEGDPESYFQCAAAGVIITQG